MLHLPSIADGLPNKLLHLTTNLLGTHTMPSMRSEDLHLINKIRRRRSDLTLLQAYPGKTPLQDIFDIMMSPNDD